MSKYRKLFDIKYHNKIFTIFLDAQNRKTFLEKKDHKYYYPDYQDFLVLHTIYNSDPTKLRTLGEYNYNEKIRFLSYLLAVEVFFTSLGLVTNKYENPNLNNTENSQLAGSLNIYNSKEILKEVLNLKTPSLQEVHETINLNPHLNAQNKTLAHTLVDTIYASIPEFDFTFFNENMKTLIIEEVTSDKIKEIQGDNVYAFYDVIENVIFVPPEVIDSAVIHELMHTTEHYFYTIGNNKYYLTPDLFNQGYFGSALDEAMNTKLTNLVIPDQTYAFDIAVLDYLSKLVPFNYLDYNKLGINYLIQNLKKQYPNLNIENIIATLDTYQESYNQGIEVVDGEKPVVEALFDLCLASINENDIFASFFDFSKLLEEDKYSEDFTVYHSYLERYIKELNTLGYSNLTFKDLQAKVQKYCETKYFIFQNSKIYPVRDRLNYNGKYYYNVITEDNHYQMVFEKDNVRLSYSTSNSNTLEEQLIKAYIANPSNFETADFWRNFTLENGYFFYKDINKIPVSYKDELLGNYYANNLKLAVTLDAKDNVGFLLTNQDNQVIYNSNPNYLKCSASFDLIVLVDWNLTKLDISPFVNLDYLMANESLMESFIPNLKITDGKVSIIPLYKVKTPEGEFNLRDFEISVYYEYLLDEPTPYVRFYPFLDLIGIDPNTVPEEGLYLEDVLAYYNILDENKLTYEFTIEEIKTLFQKYCEEVNLIKAR